MTLGCIGNNGFTVQGKKMYKYDKNIKFNVTEEQVTYILNSLPSYYLDDYMKWLTVTNILKGSKMCITNGPSADVIWVYAKTDMSA